MERLAYWMSLAGGALCIVPLLLAVMAFGASCDEDIFTNPSLIPHIDNLARHPFKECPNLKWFPICGTLLCFTALLLHLFR